jgi:predicted transcriptional regulator
MTMKTTFDLPDALVRDVKRIARERGTTARALVQQALVRVVEEAANAPAFQLMDASSTGWASMAADSRNMSLHDLVLESYERE